MSEAYLPPAVVGSLRMSLDVSTCECIAERVAEHIGVVRFTTTATDSTSPWLTTREASDYLRIGRSELQRLAAAGAIPHEQDSPGGKLYFHRDDLDGWRRSGGRRAA